MTKLISLLSILSISFALQGCGMLPAAPDTRTTQELIEQKTGRRLSINDNVRQGLQFAVTPIERRCQRDGGLLSASREATIEFSDRRRAQYPRGVVLPTRFICNVGAKPLWGADLQMADTQYLVATSIGDGVNYYATVFAQYLSSEKILSEVSRQATTRSSDSKAQESRRQECETLRETYTERIRSNPQPGMRVAFGVIVEVKGPLVLVQYDNFGRQIKRREQEWVQISELGPGEDCPR